jgi:hypothetical protein
VHDGKDVSIIRRPRSQCSPLNDAAIFSRLSDVACSSASKYRAYFGTDVWTAGMRASISRRRPRGLASASQSLMQVSPPTPADLSYPWSRTSAGHWGVPTLVFQGEPFFGQDRIDVLRWRLTQRTSYPG